MARKTEAAQLSKEEAAKRLLAVNRKIEFASARESLLRFTEITMPHPDDVDDLSMSRYEAAKHHRVMATALEEVEKGDLPRLMISMPPRHGKSEIATRRMIPWFMGRDPYRSVIFSCYSDKFAGDFGRQVGETFRSPRFKKVFPHFRLLPGASSSERMITSMGGEIHFVGRKGGATGRGADLLIIDDPIKDAEEAESPTIRESVWEWYTRTISSRLMTDVACIVIIMTRWHEDDLIGRLTDPMNPCFVREEAETWKTIKLPFFAEPDDPLGRDEGDVLWPERFSRKFGEARQRVNPRSFISEYQQRPTPEDGDYFKREWLRFYQYDQRPPLESMRIYAASDHAVGTERKKHDATVMLIAGVCPDDKLWLLDCWWDRKDSADVVEAMIYLIDKWKPIRWWAESGHISKSIGPFLYKELNERRMGNPIEESPTGNMKGANERRAQSISGRMKQGVVMFPKSGMWVAGAVDELMKFPNGTHDDFVAAISHLGMGVHRMIGRKSKKPAKVYKTGTMGWLKESSRRQAAARSFSMGSEW